MAARCFAVSVTGADELNLADELAGTRTMLQGWPANMTASPVTPLHFIAHTDETGAARRRLALRDGVRLDGNLHTLGYFSADICVGTPPTTFNLIVGMRLPARQ